MSSAFAGPDTESFGPAQVAADAIRAAAKADIAFLPAGVLKANFKGGDLAGLLQFPTDEVAVVQLTGAQVRQALEKSVAIYPSPNPGFLQLSGINATFSKSEDPNKRVVSATLFGANLDDSKKYRVAMPGSLARGGLGYFTVWKETQIIEMLKGQNLETVLKGKSGTDNQPRWKIAD
ncbi:MAG: 5'-nucleotidase C-terminal domain-containing protein [Armatimonadetes bacterium]|nr:5'-nucleotidase C-terminal domain-containing protein [Armatimonadota bacterium]